METIYRDYKIVEVFKYNNGQSDFHLFPDSGREEGTLKWNTTLEEVKADIDDKLSEYEE
jgi:hypothetical protein